MERRAVATAQTRQRIVDAAARLIVERRSTEVPIGDIAAAADVAPRTLYNHFPTVDDLMGETMSQMTEEFLAVEPGAAREDEAPIDAIRRIVGDWFRQLESHAELLDALLHIRDSPVFDAALVSARQARRARMHELVLLVELPEERRAAVTSLAYAVTGYAAWAAFVREDGRTTEEAAAIVTSTIAELLGVE
jgi:AcrR family transcriptional regulator